MPLADLLVNMVRQQKKRRSSSVTGVWLCNTKWWRELCSTSGWVMVTCQRATDKRDNVLGLTGASGIVLRLTKNDARNGKTLCPDHFSSKRRNEETKKKKEEERRRKKKKQETDDRVAKMWSIRVDRKKKKEEERRRKKKVSNKKPVPLWDW